MPNQTKQLQEFIEELREEYAARVLGEPEHTQDKLHNDLNDAIDAALETVTGKRDS